ncbi:amidohydrolase [Clostridium vincentii]|uniref:Peptidase M20 domain-containing protein 2 n=1 Tax=Clostridium vincentii TaxID=52704 RepID=A0A2T0BAI4_9CLOT|nr:amidohydrolase [Clostridium vincentii]PRR80900.1 p-aminobenzoyl-glutamate hydrolase subunit B [Clostridium vincentii]
MKQEMISFLSSIENEVKDLCEFLYSNPEESYNEIKSSQYICNLLQKYNFEVTTNYLDIPNSFYAIKGSGYPKICFLCEYDAVMDEGHITGHNALTTISLAGALALGNEVSKTGGSMILIGCPGEYLGGTKATMVKQGIFDDIDVVLECHPDIITSESGSSSAIIPLSIKFIGNSGLSFLNKGNYTSLDAILLTFNILNSLTKGFPKDLEINSILSKGGFTPLLIPTEAEAKFYIRAIDTSLSEFAADKLRAIANYVSSLTNIPNSISLYEPPNEPLITNRTLNRLFSHNLKENGIICIEGPKNVYSGLSLGVVSRRVPCIHPYIALVDDESVKYGTEAFANATISKFSLCQITKAALALAFTGLDLIEKESLLLEIKSEFYNKK